MDWLKEIQFPENNLKDIKQIGHDYWSIAPEERETESEREPIRRSVNAKLVILMREGSHFAFGKIKKFRLLRVKVVPFRMLIR